MARDFTWNRDYGSNSPPPSHGDQLPHPLEDSDNQIPSFPGRKRCQIPGVCLEGGCWSFDLTDTLPCGRNLSVIGAHCQVWPGQVFNLEKNLENRKIHQRRRSAWVGQADFGKLELNDRNHSGNSQRLSGRRDQFEKRSIWRYLKQSQKSSDLHALVVNGRDCYYSSLFQRFYENSVNASNSQAHNPSPFNVFYGNRLVNYRTVYPGKYSHRLVILRAKCSLHSQALYFLSLSLPSYWNWERRKTILWSDDQEFMLSGFISQMCQKQRQLTPTSSY